jgi:hypothetical protein
LSNEGRRARYDEKFDPATGNGGLEIRVPVRE